MSRKGRALDIPPHNVMEYLLLNGKYTDEMDELIWNE